MADEPNEPTFVDPNTDDLDAFDSLLSGKAEAKVADDKVTPENDVTPEEEDDQPDTNEAQESEEDQPDGDDEPEDKPEPKGKKVNRFQERINELTAKAREAERALEALRVEKSQKQEVPDKQNTSVVSDGPVPDALNPDGSDKYPLGEYDPEYIRDMARHTINKEWAAKKEQEEREQAQRYEKEARESLQNQWVERLAPVTEQHEDFLDKTLQLESTFDGLDTQYSDFLVQTIKSLEHGPEVLYYFANNLDEAKKFVQMGPLTAALALGEYNAMFKGQSRKETKVSKAPPPPQVNKGSKSRAAVNPDTDNLDDFANLLFKKK